MKQTGFRPPLRFCTWTFPASEACSPSSGSEEDDGDSEKDPSLEGSGLGSRVLGMSSRLDMSTTVLGLWSSVPTEFPSRKGARVDDAGQATCLTTLSIEMVPQ